MSILSNQALAALFHQSRYRPAGTPQELAQGAYGYVRIVGMPAETRIELNGGSVPYVDRAQWAQATFPMNVWTWERGADGRLTNTAVIRSFPGPKYLTLDAPGMARRDQQFDLGRDGARVDLDWQTLGGVQQGVEAVAGLLRITGLPAGDEGRFRVEVNGTPIAPSWQGWELGQYLVRIPPNILRASFVPGVPAPPTVRIYDSAMPAWQRTWEGAPVAPPGTPPAEVPAIVWDAPRPAVATFSGDEGGVAPYAPPVTATFTPDPPLGAPGQFAGMMGQVSVSGIAEGDAVTVDNVPVAQSVWDSGVRRFSVPAGKRWIRARGQEQQVEVVPGADTPVAFAMSPEAGVDRVATVSFANVPPTFTVGVWDGAQWQVVAGATARLDAGQHRFRTTDAVRVDGAPAPQNPLSAVVEQNVTGTATVDFGPAVLAALRALHEGAIVPVNVPSGASLTIAFRQVAPVTDGQTRTVIMPAEPATPYRLTRLTPGGYELVAEVGTDRRVLHVDVREGELTRADFSQAAMAPQRGTLMVTGLPPANGARRQLSVQDVMGSVTPYVVGESPALIVGTAPSDALTLSLPVGAYRIAVDDYNAAGVGANVLPWQPVTVTAGAPTVVTWRLAGGGSDGSAATAMGDVAVTGIPQGASVVITPVPPDGRWARPPVLGVNGAARIDGVPAGPALVTAMTAQGQEIRSVPITVTVGVTSVNVATGLAIGATDQNPSPSVSISPLRTLPDGRRAGRLVPATETFAQEWFRRFGAPLFQPGTGDREWAEFDVLPITDAVRAALPADQAIYAVYSAQDGGLIPSLLSRTQYDQLRAAFAGERGTATAEDAASQNAARYRRYAAIAAVVGVGSLAVGALAWFFGGGEDD